MKRITVIISLACIIAACNPGTKTDSAQYIEGKHITADNGMVVSAHFQGSQAGAMILKQGGNAVDAAVATGFALAVCFPAAGNIGGGGFMLIRTAGGEYDLIDYREKAPLEASRDMYLDSAENVIGRLSTETHLAAGVPGSVDGLIKVHEKYGRLRFREIIQPAIDLARNGFILTPEQAQGMNWNSKVFLSRNPSGCAFIKESGWKAGDTLRQPELAETLERIQQTWPCRILFRQNGRAYCKRNEKRRRDYFSRRSRAVQLGVQETIVLHIQELQDCDMPASVCRRNNTASDP